jgi:hypothetical protein
MLEMDSILRELEQNNGYFPREAVEEAIRRRGRGDALVGLLQPREGVPSQAGGVIPHAGRPRQPRLRREIPTEGRAERPVPVWQREEVQEVLRQIDAFGTTSRRGDLGGRLMRGARQVITFDKHSFRECVEKDEYVAGLRAEYARKSAEKRRMAADWEYHSAIAGSMFNDALARVGQAELGVAYWPDGVLALAIDPLFAPAILTVGSVEYQLGRQDEAMELFLTLTTLPADEPDLPTIIDKAGNFLLDAEDYSHARDLYAAAEKAFPDVAGYPAGLSYCLGSLELHEEAVVKARRADALSPGSHIHLNDLGWTLYQAGYLEEAEATLERSVSLAPPDYELARKNLEEVREVLHGKRARGSRVGVT